jgi:hypothetical protein
MQVLRVRAAYARRTASARGGGKANGAATEKAERRESEWLNEQAAVLRQREREGGGGSGSGSGSGAGNGGNKASLMRAGREKLPAFAYREQILEAVGGVAQVSYLWTRR